MNSFDRSSMVDTRRQHMQRRASTMRQLSELLAGRWGFDRARAVQLARDIERSAAAALARGFHPGAVIDSDSRTTRSLWGNEEMFKANAQKPQQAAKALADELEKAPGKEEGAVYLREQRAHGDREVQTVAVSPKIRKKSLLSR